MKVAICHVLFIALSSLVLLSHANDSLTDLQTMVADVHFPPTQEQKNTEQKKPEQEKPEQEKLGPTKPEQSMPHPKKKVHAPRKRFLEHVIRNHGLNLCESLLSKVREYLNGKGRTAQKAHSFYTQVIEELGVPLDLVPNKADPPTRSHATVNGKRKLLGHVTENRPLLRDFWLKERLLAGLNKKWDNDAEVDELYKEVVWQLLTENGFYDHHAHDKDIESSIAELQMDEEKQNGVPQEPSNHAEAQQQEPPTLLTTPQL